MTPFSQKRQKQPYIMDFPGHTLSTGRSVGRGTGFSYTPCLLMKPVLRLRLHATQSQPCFPAASNALALTGGNSIFTATLTERITHYQSRPVIPSPPSDAVPRIAAVLHSTAHHLNLPAFPCPEHCQMIPPHG